MQVAIDKVIPVWRRPAVVRLLVVALLGELGIAILNASAMPVYLTAARGFSPALVGVVLAAFLISEAAIKPFAGHWADKHGRRPLLIAAPTILILTPLLTMVVPQGYGMAEAATFVGLRVLDGVAAALLWPAMYAAVGEAVEGRERGQAMGLLNVCFMLGLAFGIPAGGGVNEYFQNYNASFYLASAIFVLTAVAAFFFAPTKEPVAQEDGEEHAELHLSDMWVCVRRIPFVLVLGFVAFLAVGFPAPIIKLFALDNYHITELQYGLAVLCAALVMAVFSSHLGALGEKMGRSKAVQLGMLLCAVGAWPIGGGMWFDELRGPLIAIFGAILIGFGFLLAIPAWYSSVSHIDEKRTGSYLGAVMTAQGIGAIIGVLVGGKIYQLAPFSPFLACAIAVTVAWALSLLALDKEDGVKASE